MGFLKDQSLRLLRDDWVAGARALAEELYAIFNGEGPTTVDGPLKVTTPAGSTEPGMIINQLGSSDVAIRINKAALPGTDFAGSTTDFNSDGTVTVRDSDGNEQPEEAKGGGIPGTVTSGGPGANYQVLLFDNRTVAVTQLQIAGDATIPAGTKVIVTKFDGSYYMACPVWLAPP